MPAARQWAAMLLLLMSLAASHGKLPDAEFESLLKRVAENPSAARSLRRVFTPMPYTTWNSPDSLGTTSKLFANITFTVVVYHIPPFVIIDDAKGLKGDHGNANGTRTAENLRITGFTIDTLGLLADQLGCKFKYIYPCRKATIAASGQCEEIDYASSAQALSMVKGDVNSLLFAGITPDFCPNELCFAAGAIKLSDQVVKDFFTTNPYMEQGMKILVKAQQAPVEMMAWAGPFALDLWVVVLAEIFFVAILFMIVEGYGTNPSLPMNRVGQFFDSFFWSLTLVLGVADKQPSTHAGRTLTMAQLFFALLLVSVYTGNLNNFLLNRPLVYPMDNFQDAINPTTKKYRSDWLFCTPQIQTSVSKWLDLQKTINPTATFKTIEARDVLECIDFVYRGKADVTFYDELVLLYQIQNDFYSKGKCGYPGGICSDPLLTDKETCLCPSRTLTGECIANQNKWESFSGSLVTRGENFSPFGYTLAFKKGSNTHYMPFSQATQYIKELVLVDGLIDKWIPAQGSMECSTDGASIPTLGLSNMMGMGLITAGLAAVGLIIGLTEHFVSVCVSFCPCCGCLEDELMAIEMELERVHDVNEERDGTRDGTFDMKHTKEGLGTKMQKNRMEDEAPMPPGEEEEDAPIGENELTVVDALLELQTRLDRIEDLLESALGR